MNELLIFEPNISAQEELEALMKVSSGKMTWTVIIVRVWYDWGVENNVFWINKQNKTITRFGSGHQKYAISRLGAISDFVIEVLKEPSRFRNRPAYFASHIVNTNQLARLTREVMADIWKVTDVSLDGFMEIGRKIWEADSAEGVENEVATRCWELRPCSTKVTDMAVTLVIGLRPDVTKGRTSSENG